MKIVDDAGNDLPQDGSVSGNMVVRGPWIVKGYMKGDGKSQFVDGRLVPDRRRLQDRGATARW